MIKLTTRSGWGRTFARQAAIESTVHIALVHWGDLEHGHLLDHPLRRVEELRVRARGEIQIGKGLLGAPSCFTSTIGVGCADYLEANKLVEITQVLYIAISFACVGQHLCGGWVWGLVQCILLGSNKHNALGLPSARTIARPGALCIVELALRATSGTARGKRRKLAVNG